MVIAAVGLEASLRRGQPLWRLIIAAIALSAFASSNAVLAQSGLSAADLEICPVLELAHESSCVELEAVLADRQTAAFAAAESADPQTTGSVPAAEHAKYSPFLNYE
jgi:hypothetical protein